MNELGLKDIFSPAASFKEFNPELSLEKAPEDYDPYARMRGVKPVGNPTPKQQGHRPMNSDIRGQILGEIKLSSKFVSSQNSLTNKFMSNDKKA